MYIVYYSVYCDHFGVLIGCCVSEFLRLFIVVLTLFTKLFRLRKVYYNIYHDYCGVFIEKYVYTMFWSLCE